ncbi:MAG: hypothetical protein IJP25_02380 [Elusimicrobiaceae bacterium]|nr:hypothetical protein [Elusimicrobiaceae bacterium]
MSQHPYEDIIHLSRPESKRHGKMPLLDRAAQFSPFAALTGFEEGLEETARKTSSRIELAESEKNLINEKLLLLADKLSHCAIEADLPQITLEYYEKDTLKEGGHYLYKTGQVKKIDPYNQEIVFLDGAKVFIGDVVGVQL